VEGIFRWNPIPGIIPMSHVYRVLEKHKNLHHWLQLGCICKKSRQVSLSQGTRPEPGPAIKEPTKLEWHKPIPPLYQYLPSRDVR
jgi:hypothetical protein